jgi:hypothetical protein
VTKAALFPGLPVKKRGDRPAELRPCQVACHWTEPK